MFLLYNAERTVARLLDAALAQIGPGFDQDRWLRVLFVDDFSRDKTLEVLSRALEKRGNPGHVTVLPHERNLGLAATLNDSLKRVTTPYALTCHCDVLFGRDDYAWGMVQAFERNSRWAAITGKPTLSEVRIGFAEKLNHVSNLMDVLPVPSSAPDFVATSFAEGRCDGFRIDALREVGFYDTSLRTSGEDQVLAHRLRGAGYEVIQGVRMPYVLSVSEEQNTVPRIVRHAHLFGTTQPVVLAKTRSTGTKAVGNREARRALRVCQLIAFGFYVSAGMSQSALALACGLMVSGGKLILAKNHFIVLRTSAWEAIRIALVQPMLDFAYGLGFMRGITRAVIQLEKRA